MKIKAISPWFGAKRTLATQIVTALGPHSCYWEPFCGSMAILLAKPRCSMETVNDLHGDLINLAKVIADAKDGPRLYRWLRRTLMVEQLHREAKAYLEQPFLAGVERAYWYFLGSWLGMNGVAGTKKYNNGFCVRYSGKGGNAGRRTVSAIDSIPAWHRRLRCVCILCKDGFEILERLHDAEGTAIYVDPPYFQKGAKYVHDFAEADHLRLADLLHRFQKAHVILSYYDHERVRELYRDWQCERVMVTKSLVQAGRRGVIPQKACELILCNHELQARHGKGLWEDNIGAGLGGELFETPLRSSASSAVESNHQ